MLAADPGAAAGEELLAAVIDTIVPADGYPSAVESGGLAYLAGVFAERPDWAERAAAALAVLSPPGDDFLGRDAAARLAAIDDAADDEDVAWLVRTVNAGYYADPDNGGNAGAASWRMIGWSPEPRGGWGETGERRAPRERIVGPGSLAARYDAIVIGSGAGGGVAACALAEAGRTVLVVEAGSWPDTASLAKDHLRNPRSSSGLGPRSGPVDLGNPRVLDANGVQRVLRPSDGAWSNNAMTVGGGTRVYGAQAWRFGPKDFRMASTYGVPDGSALSDWPIGYDEMEPYYERAEWEIGVSGGDTDGAHSGHRSRPYPMGPLPSGSERAVLARGAEAMGLATLPVPLLVNSRDYLGRPACAQCSLCVGFACPVDAKNGSQNTVLDRAFATGLCSIVLETAAARLVTDRTGRVIAVELAGTRDGKQWRASVAAEQFVVAGGAVESARLLLNSRSDTEPDGIGNNAGQVGRYLQGHLYGGAVGVFEQEFLDPYGPGPSIASGDFRHGNAGIVGGGILANEFVPTPSSTFAYLAGAGLIPAYGPGSKRGMRSLARRMVRVMGPIQEVTTSEARVTVDPSVRDRNGIPVARLSGSVHAEDLVARDFTTARCADWLRASGASTVVPMAPGVPIGPSSGQHQAGTLRMGDDPARSATDPIGRVWGHDNLRVVDGSLHVTNGGVNPVLTIFAGAMRVMDALIHGTTAAPSADARRLIDSTQR